MGGQWRRDETGPRGGEAEAPRVIVDGHCSLLTVRSQMQLTESASRGSSRRVQIIVGMCTRSNMVL